MHVVVTCFYGRRQITICNCLQQWFVAILFMLVCWDKRSFREACQNQMQSKNYCNEA